MQLVHSEKLVRDVKETNIYYTTRNIERVFSVYAQEGSLVRIGVIQWEGRRVVLDCADIPDDIPVFITYFSDEEGMKADIIPIGRMIEEVVNKFGGRTYCHLADSYIHEKLVYNINYLNRTKVNKLYNRQFTFTSFQKKFEECIYRNNCMTPREAPTLPPWGCDLPTEKEADCAVDPVVEKELPIRFRVWKDQPKAGILRLKSGEYIHYTEIEDGIHLEGQHNMNNLSEYTIGYWIPSKEITSVKIDGKPTSRYDIKENHIFINEVGCHEITIDYVERYSECSSDTICVEFDSTFWKLPVYMTIVDIAIDETDDRLNLWKSELDRMRKDYSVVIARDAMDFDFKRNKISDRQYRYNSRYYYK